MNGKYVNGFNEKIMKKIITRGVHEGYEIGLGIMIHNHISDPDNWFLTIRKLEMFGVTLCSKKCTEQEIARYVNLKLHKRLNDLNELIESVIPFT